MAHLVRVRPVLAWSTPNEGDGPAVNVPLEVVLDGTTTRVPLFQDRAGTMPLPQPITAGARGFTQEFWAQVDTLTTQLAWLSGGVRGGGIEYDKEAAALAQQAVEEAGVVATQSVTGARGAGGALVLTTAAGADLAPIPLPPGPKGDQGSPGVNAVPASEAVAAYLSDTGTPVPAAFVAAGLQTFARRTQVDVREYGPLATGTGAADANTATILAALASVDGDVFIPDGAWYAIPGQILVPNQRRLVGVRSAKYAGLAPTKGTRLLAPSATGSGPLVRLGELAMINDIALAGLGGATAFDGLQLGKFSSAERVVIRGFRDGVAGNYSNACTLRDLNVFSNTRYGLRDIVDSGVYGGFYNANGSDGIYLGTGANDNIIRPTKLEWNDGHGVNLYLNYQNIVSSIIDRNGKAGVALTSTGKTIVEAPILRRNGRLSASSINDDAHFFIQGTTDTTILVPLTTAGPDDDGNGYVSPRFFSRENGNVRLNIVGGFLGGATEAVKRSTFTAPNTDSFETATVGNPFFDRRAAGQVASWSATVPGASTGTMTIKLPVINTFSVGDLTEIDVVLRNPSAGSRGAARIPIMRHREAGGAVVTVSPPVNYVATVFGLPGAAGATVTVTATISTDGSELLVNFLNTNADSRILDVRAS